MFNYVSNKIKCFRITFVNYVNEIDEINLKKRFIFHCLRKHLHSNTLTRIVKWNKNIRTKKHAEFDYGKINLGPN
jgi:hypothetical protein